MALSFGSVIFSFYICSIIIKTKTMDKRQEIVSMVIDIFDRIGIDTPSNFDEIAEFIYDDVNETADPTEWHSGDVAIAFRRWIESNEK